MTRYIVTALAVASLSLACTVDVSAETSSEDAYEYRESAMTALRGHIGAVSKIVRGLVEDRGFLLRHAEGLANGTAELDHLFPEGSAIGDSEALPAIWEDPEEFAAAIDEAQKATEAFRKVVAEGGDRAAIGSAFRDVGDSCRGCHDRFRADDD